MFIYNLKVNSNFLLKVFLVLLILIILSIVFFSVYKLFVSSSYSNHKSTIYQLTSDNYTNVLKTVHDNLDTYIGQQISFSGYVYRVSDFESNQFVLARNMIISSNFQTLVVGFLCNSSFSSLYPDGTWVYITRNYYKRKLSW